MIIEYQLPNFKWVDVQEPSDQELQTLHSEYDVNFDIIKDLSAPISDTRISCVQNQTYLAFHQTSAQSLTSEPSWLELDVIILDDTLITVVYETFPAIANLRKELEIEAVLKHQVDITLEHFLIGLLSKIHISLRELTAAINNHQKRIEQEIFAGTDRRMVRKISETGRVLFSLNQTVAEQRHVLKFLPHNIKNDLPMAVSLWQRELEHTADQVKAQYDLYHDLRRTNEELLSTRQNEAMRKLTLVAFITSPLTILAGIFGMNTRSTPFVGSTNDFWTVIAVMTFVVLVIVFALYQKGWFD